MGVVASVSGVAASPPDGLDFMPFAPPDSAVVMAWTGEGTRNVERAPPRRDLDRIRGGDDRCLRRSSARSGGVRERSVTSWFPIGAQAACHRGRRPRLDQADRVAGSDRGGARAPADRLSIAGRRAVHPPGGGSRGRRPRPDAPARSPGRVVDRCDPAALARGSLGLGPRDGGSAGEGSASPAACEAGRRDHGDRRASEGTSGGRDPAVRSLPHESVAHSAGVIDRTQASRSARRSVSRRAGRVGRGGARSEAPRPGRVDARDPASGGGPATPREPPSGGGRRHPDDDPRTGPSSRRPRSASCSPPGAPGCGGGLRSRCLHGRLAGRDRVLASGPMGVERVPRASPDPIDRWDTSTSATR